MCTGCFAAFLPKLHVANGAVYKIRSHIEVILLFTAVLETHIKKSS